MRFRVGPERDGDLEAERMRFRDERAEAAFSLLTRDESVELQKGASVSIYQGEVHPEQSSFQ